MKEYTVYVRRTTIEEIRMLVTVADDQDSEDAEHIAQERTINCSEANRHDSVRYVACIGRGDMEDTDDVD